MKVENTVSGGGPALARLAQIAMQEHAPVDAVKRALAHRVEHALHAAYRRL